MEEMALFGEALGQDYTEGEKYLSGGLQQPPAASGSLEKSRGKKSSFLESNNVRGVHFGGGEEKNLYLSRFINVCVQL